MLPLGSLGEEGSPIGDASDIEGLLAAHKHAKRMGWVKTGLVALSSLAGSAMGAGWVARGYLEQLATKSQVAELIAGQQAQIGGLLGQESAMAIRMAVSEAHDREQDKAQDNTRADVKELQGRAGVLVRGRQ
jgi:hypothetical protein